MLAGYGHTFYWAGAAGPPPAGVGFHETLCGAMKTGGRRGGFKPLLVALLIQVAAVLEWL